MKISARFIFVLSLTLSATTVSASTMGKVVRILDGRTVTVDFAGNQVPIRLAGIDIPGGIDSRGKSYESAASDYLSAELLSRFVLVDYDPAIARTDRDGRTLAYLYRSPDGLFVNHEVIRRGSAVVSRDTCSLTASFAEAEGQARAIGAGYWSANVSTASLASNSRMTYLGLVDPSSGRSRSTSRNASVREGTSRTVSGTRPSSSRSSRQQPIIVVVETAHQ